MILVDDRLANNSMATGRVDDMDKSLKEFECIGDFEELRGDSELYGGQC